MEAWQLLILVGLPLAIVSLWLRDRRTLTTRLRQEAEAQRVAERDLRGREEARSEGIR